MKKAAENLKFRRDVVLSNLFPTVNDDDPVYDDALFELVSVFFHYNFNAHLYKLLENIFRAEKSDSGVGIKVMDRQIRAELAAGLETSKSRRIKQVDTTNTY